MLENSDVIATVAVKDLQQAKDFYGGVLGLSQTDENPGGVTYTSGTGRVFVYMSPNAGTNKATCANWEVDDLEGIVQQLDEKGVSFEHYDMPGATRDGHIHDWGGMKAAWFRDPSGNILGLSAGHAG